MFPGVCELTPGHHRMPIRAHREADPHTALYGGFACRRRQT
jgi:hypothetical protein